MMASEESPQTVIAKIHYFSRNTKFDTEKSYVTSFPVEGIEADNIAHHLL
jgi:hypothetical protein